MTFRDRRGYLGKKFLDAPDLLTPLQKFNTPCYFCVLPRCDIMPDEALETKCNDGLMKQGASWACPYFVKGMCAYRSDKYECALQANPMDVTPDLPVLLELKNLQHDYILNYFNYKYSMRRKKHKTRKPKSLPGGAYAKPYLELMKEVIDGINPECACNYWLECSDFSTSGVLATSSDVLAGVRQGIIPTRKTFWYTWIKPQSEVTLGHYLPQRQVRKSLPILNMDYLRWIELHKRIKTEVKSLDFYCTARGCKTRVSRNGELCRKHENKTSI